MRSMTGLKLWIVILLLVSHVRTHAQEVQPPFIDKLPAKALFYMGWQGFNEQNTAYTQSHFKALVDQISGSPLAKAWPGLYQQLTKDAEPRGQQALKNTTNIIKLLGAYPTGICLESGTAAAGHEDGGLTILSKAGPNAQAVAQQLIELTSNDGQMNQLMHITAEGDNVLMLFGFNNTRAARLESIRNGFDEATLSQNTKLINDYKVLAKVTPQLFIFIDGNESRKLTSDLTQGDQSLQTMLDASGVSNMNTISISSIFHQKKWVSHALVRPSGDRKGILKIFNKKPLTPAEHQLLPAESKFGIVSRVNWGKTIDTVGETLKEVAPNKRDIRDELKMAGKEMLGFEDVRKDLIDALGEFWGLSGYTTNNGLGIVLDLRQSVKNRENLEPVIARYSAMVGQMMNNNEMFKFGKQNKGDNVEYTLTGLKFPMSMSWTLNDQFMQMKVRIFDNGGALPESKGAFVDTDRAKAFLNLVGAKNVNYLAHTDISMYRTFVNMARIAPQAAPLFNVAPVELINNILNGDVITARWADDNGLHFASSSPYPGSGILSLDTTNLLLLGSSMGYSQVQQSRTAANQTISATQLKSIHIRCEIYANKHGGKYPAHLADLIIDGNLPPRYMLNPRTADRSTLASFPRNGDRDAMIKWIDTHGGYVYLKSGQSSSTIDTNDIVAYERVAQSGLDRINILRGDGAVLIQPVNFVRDKLKRQGHQMQ